MNHTDLLLDIAQATFIDPVSGNVTATLSEDVLSASIRDHAGADTLMAAIRQLSPVPRVLVTSDLYQPFRCELSHCVPGDWLLRDALAVLTKTADDSPDVDNLVCLYWQQRHSLAALFNEAMAIMNAARMEEQGASAL